MKKKRTLCVGGYEDERDDLLLQKSDHAHRKPFIVYYRIGVIDRCKVPMPIDSVVIGASVIHGEVHLRIQVVPSKHDIITERFFYVLDHERVMQYPYLGYVSDFRIGGKMWMLYEDDMTT